MIHRRRAWKLPSALVGAAFLLGGGVPAWGAVQTFVVNSTADVANSTPTSKACATAGPNPVCTLRAAIQASNANSGTDTISLPAGVYTLTIAGRNEDAAATGDLDITDAVNITGAGAGSAIIDGNGIDRVFDVFANGTTTISGVTIRKGNPGAAAGGGIFSGAVVGNNVVSLNLSNVIVTQNTNTNNGGGIANSDSISLTDVTVSNNTCVGQAGLGGGIFNQGTATLNRVTLSGNSASGGGGLGSDFDVNLTNVTIYGNSADSGAAIMHNGGLATLVNVTISNNNAAPGGGGFFNLGDATFKYTIFADAPASETCMNFGTSFTSGGHNVDVGTSCGLTGTGDLRNTDPVLGPLQSNGGPTVTQALLMGSPAIDAGGTDCPPPFCDQRGPGHCSVTTATACCRNADCPSGQTCIGAFARPLDGNHDGIALCDIGAYESNGTFPTTTTSTTTTAPTSTTTSTTRPTTTTTTRPTTTTTTSTTTTRPTTTTTSSSTTTTRPTTTTTTVTTSTTTTTTQPTTTTTSTTTSTTSTTTTTIPCGDVNGDGVVNIGDALLTAQYDVGLRTCGQAPFSHSELCDVNRDGACNIGDALKMAQCDVGLISCAFVCNPFSCP